MAQTNTPAPPQSLLDDILWLAADVRPAWDDLSAAIPPWHPRNEGDPAGAAAGAATEEPVVDPPDEDPPNPGPAKPGEENDPAYLRAQARKHEAAAKKAVKRQVVLQNRLDEVDAANLSEKEREIKAAREEARSEALTEAGRDRRADKIELAVTKIAVQTGVTIGEGDKAKTVKFADPEDVEMWLERQIAKGEIDGDELYADGKVNDEVLTEALAALANSKPGWLAGGPASAANGTPAGDADAGKGGSATASGSVADDLRAIQKHKP